VKIPQAEGLKIVFTIAIDDLATPSPESPLDDPPLNNNQENQSIMVPKMASKGLCALMLFSSSLNLYFLTNS
jgi:hypothetical protein